MIIAIIEVLLMAEVFSICMQKEVSLHERPYHYSRVPVSKANLRAGHGIEGDLKAGHHPQRHLNIMSQETLHVLADEGFRTNPGEMGEQLIIKGLDIDRLEEGTQLHIGAEAIVTLHKMREGCEWFQEVQGKSPKIVAGRMGIMASVTVSGRIRVGDKVAVVKAAQAIT
jgi:MOSC domain-containing protein YiiM